MVDPVLLLVLPLLGAFILPSAYRFEQTGVGWIGPLLLVLNLALALQLGWQVMQTGPVVSTLGGFAAPLGIVLYADYLGIVFTAAVAVTALLLWPRGEVDRARESALVLLLVAGASGLALSGDLFNLYVFYELVAVASYGLAASRASGMAYAAALRFLVLSVIGSALALLGIALVYALTGTLNLAHLAQLAPEHLDSPTAAAAAILIIIGFGVKAELFPVNTWVPEVYAVAPSRVSALLAGVISKLALVVVLRLLVLVFAETPAVQMLLVIGVLGVLTGELAAYRAQDLRRTLAYSSIAQLGLVAIAFSLSSTAGVAAGVLLALHHLLVKSGLFLLAERWGGALHHLNGVARSSPTAGVVFVILSLSLIGVPPLPGFWAKLALLQALFQGEGAAVQGIAALVLLASVVEAAYLFRIIGRMYRQDQSLMRAPAMADLLPAVLFGGGIVSAALLIAPIQSAVTVLAAQFMDTPAYVAAVLGGGG